MHSQNNVIQQLLRQLEENCFGGGGGAQCQRVLFVLRTWVPRVVQLLGAHTVPVSVSGVAGELGGSGVTEADTAGNGQTGSQHSRSGNSLARARRPRTTTTTTSTFACMLCSAYSHRSRLHARSTSAPRMAVRIVRPVRHSLARAPPPHNPTNPLPPTTPTPRHRQLNQFRGNQYITRFATNSFCSEVIEIDIK